MIHSRSVSGPAWAAAALVGTSVVAFGGRASAQWEMPPDLGVHQIQRSFHHAGLQFAYRPTLGWVGRLSGDVALEVDGTLAGSLQVVTRYGDGTLLPRLEPLDGIYHFEVDGRVVFDFWPAFPGADQHWWWSDPEAIVLHLTGSSVGRVPMLWLATEALTQARVALLDGPYIVHALQLQPQGGLCASRDVTGVLVCDGFGQGALSGTERTITTAGGVTQQPLQLAVPYAIAADGTLSAFGGLGAVSGDGELFFVLTQDAGQQEFGMWVGVKAGQSTDLRDLAGRLSVSGIAADLLASPAGPSATSWNGTIDLAAVDPMAGQARLDGLRLLTTQQTFAVPSALHSPTPIAATRSGTSEVTLADAELQWTLSFSDNGRYWIGRVPGQPASLLVGTRQAAASVVLGQNFGNFVPGLGLRGFPTLGNADFGLRLNRGRGGAPAVLAFAAQPSVGEIVLDNLLWIDPATALATVGLVLGGAPGVPDVGAAEHSLPVPNLAALAGLELAVQAAVFEPLRAGGFATSRGLLVRFGP